MFGFALFLSSCQSLSCKNLNGNNVDWFAVFKMPAGIKYMYRDPSTSLKAGKNDLNSTSGNPLYYTMKDMYSNSNVGYIFINDQTPDGDATKKFAHDKAVIMWDSSNAVYIEHSTPKFPGHRSQGYFYPTTGKTYGQAFLCMSLTHSELNTIAGNMLVEIPKVYESRIPSFTSNKMPNIQKMIDASWTDGDYMSKKSTFSGITQFVKSRKNVVDIYRDIIMKALGVDGYSETWQNGSGGVLASDCSGSHNMYNIDSVSYDLASFKSSKDHSKWAVFGSYVCIGGVNRVQSQAERGGQQFCLKNSAFAKEMSNVINEVESC